MEKEPKVCIVILNYYRLNDLIECINSLYKMNYSNYSVIVVDNSCNESYFEIIKNKFSKIDIIKNKKNLGYTGGNNLGIKRGIESGAEYIWLLNDDTVVDPACLRNIVDVAEKDTNIGLVSPVIYYYENSYKWQFSGSYIDWKCFSLRYPNNQKKVDEIYQIGNNVCLWGTALLIKKEVVNKIGYLKQEFFAYWEDTEYSLRSLKNGFKNVVCNNAKVYHKRQIEILDGNCKGNHYYYYMQRNKKLMINIYKTRLIDRVKFNIRYLAALADYLRRCEKQYRDFALAGGWDAITKKAGAMEDIEHVPSCWKNILLIASKLRPVFLADLITLNFKEIAMRKNLKT